MAKNVYRDLEYCNLILLFGPETRKSKGRWLSRFGGYPALFFDKEEGPECWGY